MATPGDIRAILLLLEPATRLMVFDVLGDVLREESLRGNGNPSTPGGELPQTDTQQKEVAQAQIVYTVYRVRYVTRAIFWCLILSCGS